MFTYLKRRRREKLIAQPFLDAHRRILKRRVPYYNRLPETDQRRLEQHVQIFLAEKHFEGCADFEVTEDVRVTIAGHACILLLNRPGDYYPRVRTVLVYPEPFFADTEEEGPDGVMGFDSDERAGESWDRGAVILAWDEVLLSAEDDNDGYNVVLHEFAHQLDFEVRQPANDAVFGRMQLAEEWGELFLKSYDQLVKDVNRNRRTLLDDYAATNEAEFFAVATETFFEIPRAFQNRYPDLYTALANFYQQDPVALNGRAPTPQKFPRPK